MNVSDQLPKYINFIDTHLKLKVLNFYLTKNQSDENLTKLYKAELFKTGLESLQNDFIQKYKINDIDNKERNEKIKKDENELKQNIFGYLNLIENCKQINNYDTSQSMNKKIVNFFNFRWTKHH
jgi:hypothetical protein